MKLSISINAVFNQYPFIEALQMMHSGGVTAFEFWGWWDQDVDQIIQTKHDLGLTCVACCTRFISLVDAAQRDAYLQGLTESIAVAKRLGCTTLISQVGDDIGIPREQQHQSLIDGLKAAVPLLEAANIQLAIEPLNTLVDHAGYYLTSSDEAFAIVEAVDSPYVTVLFDIYHQQITEGHLIERITRNIGKIGHFHAAGNPGRHELTIGELSYHEIFRAIDETGFQGYVGLEYFPIHDPVEGFQPFI